MAPGRREVLLYGGVGLAAALAGLFVGPLVLQSRSGAAGLLAASFRDLAGKPRRLIEFQGRALVCNFWATWCAPCREEMPLFAVAARKYAGRGVEMVGIGIDNAAKIGEFAAKYGIDYLLLVAGPEAIELMRSLGNRSGGLPFTVGLDRRGALTHHKLGPLSAAEIEAWLAELSRPAG